MLFHRAFILNFLGFHRRYYLFNCKVRRMHSLQRKIEGEAMSVYILPALQDNFMYLVVDKKSKEAAVVDPVNPSLIMNTIKDDNIVLTTILTTHHHWDHAGGNENLFEALTNIQVLGGSDRIKGINKIVSDGDIFNIGELKVMCLSTPCHTSDHICYFITSSEANDPPCVFTGDTLFTGGCGKFFEGTAQQMYDALYKKLGELPDETKVYCGHEYTCKNLEFGLTIEPNNEEIGEKLEWALSQRQTQAPTVPSTIGNEKKTNPFMRVHEATVMEYTATTDPIATMASLRREKNKFK